jgi:hypothetical protein
VPDVETSVTFDRELLQAVRTRAKELGLRTSDYLRILATNYVRRGKQIDVPASRGHGRFARVPVSVRLSDDVVFCVGLAAKGSGLSALLRVLAGIDTKAGGAFTIEVQAEKVAKRKPNAKQVPRIRGKV